MNLLSYLPLRQITILIVVYQMLNVFRIVLADGSCSQTGCISCPHGQEACYQCTTGFVLINYNCLPIGSQSVYSYFAVQNGKGQLVQYSEICPEETSYIDDSVSPSLCIPCPNQCDGCYLQPQANGSRKVQCWDCALGYYMQNSLNYQEADRYSSSWNPTCVQINQAQTLNLVITITTTVQASELNSIPNFNCASQSLTFGSFFTALVFVESVCSQKYTQGQLTFTFQNGNHFIMIDNANYSAQEKNPDFIFEFFRNSNYDITINSASTKNQVTLYWRTEKIRFYIFKSLSLSGVTIDGSENKLYSNLSDPTKASCFTQRSLCCNGATPQNYVCNNGPKRQYRATGKTYQPDAVGMGLFNLMSSNRYTTYTPTIQIDTIDVRNMMMFYSDSIRYFIKIHSNYGLINLSNVNIDKYYFTGGLISNYRYVQPKRGSYSYIDQDIGLQRRTDCRMQVPNLQHDTYCLVIFLTASTFQNYNYEKYTRLFLDYTDNPKFIESYTLHLFSTLALINIQKSKFLNAMVSSTMVDADKEFFISSQVMQCKNSYDQSSESDLLKSSYLKTNPNQHFDQDKISQHTQMLGSHIVWQYIKGNFLMDTNTFDSNIGYQNPAISMMGYSQYMGASLKSSYIIFDSNGNFAYVANAAIFIQNSIFTNNFAFVANSVMSFYQNQNSMPFNTGYMSCMGMKFLSNTFQNNLGCPTSYFVVSINCRFQTLTTSFANNWYQELNPTNTQQENGDLFTQVVFRSNKFIQNYAIVSNSLFITGARDINIDSNTFDSNGVLIDQTKGQINANNNPYINIVNYNKATYPYFNTNWMTESSVLFLQYPVSTFITNNIFTQNWALSSGDSYIGQSVMLHKIVSVTDVKIYNNQFLNHNGLPSSFITQGSQIGQAYSTLPIISVNLYTNYHLARSIGFAIQIDFYQNTFVNNQYKINTNDVDALNIKYNTYTLYSLGGYVQLIKFFTDNEVLGSQPVSNDYLYMMYSQVNFLIRNSNFTQNTHYNGGCLIEVSGLNLLQGYGNTFQSNNNDFQSAKNNQFGGMICMLQNSPVTLANTTNNEPILNLMQSTANGDKGIHVLNQLVGSYIEIGDMNFIGFQSSNSILISSDSGQVNMEGNLFNSSVAINGFMSFKRVGKLIMQDLQVVQSFPYTIYLESTYNYQLNGLIIQNNDLSLFSSYIQSKMSQQDYKNLISSGVQVLYLYRSRGLMLNSYFNNNQVSSAAVALLRDNSLLTATNLNVTNNFAQNIGSNFYVIDTSVLNLVLSNFQNNTSSLNGGCFFVQNSYFSISQTNVSFCLSKQNAGVGRIEQSVVDISNSTFQNNTALSEASLLYSISSTINIKYSNFFNNSANSCGIIASTVELFILGSNFTGNSANIKTKNIYATQSTLQLKNSFFNDTQPINQVSGAFIQLFKSTGQISSSQFYNGKSNYGGAIMVEAFSDVQVDSCLFINNYAIQSGGAIASSSYLSVSNSNFTLNQASLNGNDVYIKCQDDFIVTNVRVNASFGISMYVWARSFQAFQLNITGNSSLIQQNQLNQMKGLYLFQTPSSIIQDSYFSNLFSIQGSALNIVNQLNQKVMKTQIISSVFTTNQAQQGGALKIDGLTNTYIIDTNFYNNIAYYFNDTIGTGNGGGLYYSCPLTFSNCSLQIVRCSFINNQAEMDGGAIKFDQSEVQIDFQTQFANNYAIYGPDKASYPIHLYKTNSTNQQAISDFQNPDAFSSGFQKLVEDSYNFESEVSGQKFEIYYALVDHYGNIVLTANSSYARFYTFTSGIYLESGNQVSKNGYFNFTDFVVTINPGDILQMMIETDSIPDEWLSKARNLQLKSQRLRQLQQGQSSNLLDLNNSKGTVPVYAQFRKCKIGEIQDSNKCVPCSYNKFSNIANITEGAIQCKECLQNSFCAGLNNVAPLSGFWRLTDISENFIQCPNAQACLGGLADGEIESNTGSCSAGYQGNLCLACSDGYAKYGKSECVICQNNILYNVRAIVTIIITLGMISLGIKNQLDNQGSQKDYSICLIKIFGNFTQTISIISLFQLQWPSSVGSVASINNQYLAAPLQVFSMDCYFRGFGVSTSLVRVFITIVTPLVVMLSSIVFFCIYYSIKVGIKLYTDKDYQKKLKNAIIITQLVIIFVFHPQIVTASFSLFQCQQLGDTSNPQKFSQIEPQLNCFEGEHLNWVKYLGVPSLVLWVFIIPLIMALALWKYKDIIDRPDIVATYGFITKGYRAEFFFWEIVIMYRKSILVIGSIFWKLDPFLTGLNILLYLFFWLIIQQKFQPFLTGQLNRVEEYSLLTSVFFIYFSLYFIVDEHGSVISILMIILLMVTYIGFYAYFGLVYSKQKIMEVTETITNLSQEVKNPFLVVVFGRLAEIKILSCAKNWFLEQKELVEAAILRQKSQQDEKMNKEIQNCSNQQLVKDQIKEVVQQQMISKIQHQDVFLQIKKKNKELFSTAQKFTDLLLKKEDKIQINDKLKGFAQKIKQKRQLQEDMIPLNQDFQNTKEITVKEEQNSFENDENINF
ncbi:hypothetical protein ABPG72_017382 [Tetrahymena utriculariae]